MSVFRTIVAAIDFSETSDDALRVACELAACHGSELHLLHVIPDARQQAWSVEAPGLDFSALQQESMADAERMLADPVAQEWMINGPTRLFRDTGERIERVPDLAFDDDRQTRAFVERLRRGE